jgi:hypothetical protein
MDDGASYLASLEEIFAASGSGDTTCVDACVARNFVEHAMLLPGGTTTGIQNVTDTIVWSRKAFPDMQIGLRS